MACEKTILATQTHSRHRNNENFPVASWLIAKNKRAHVLCYYAFARAADNVADSPNLDRDAKKSQLALFRRALNGEIDENLPDEAIAVRYSLQSAGVPLERATDLLDAFCRDVDVSRYESWDRLMDYCRLSAAPVGRYLIDMMGGAKGNLDTSYQASDGLCHALQVLNHLQDCGEDYTALNRIYLPSVWIARMGAKEDMLSAAYTAPELRDVMDLALDGVDDLLCRARRLPALVKSTRLAMESAVILNIAERLAKQLRQRDPLAERVQLSKGEVLAAFFVGMWRGLCSRVSKVNAS